MKMVEVLTHPLGTKVLRIEAGNGKVLRIGEIDDNKVITSVTGKEGINWDLTKPNILSANDLLNIIFKTLE